MRKSFLFISCDEAKHICDKAQYGEANSWDKIKLNLRLSWCHITKHYSKKNKKLTEVLQHSNLNCLDKTERHHLETEFQKELAKHKNQT